MHHIVSCSKRDLAKQLAYTAQGGAPGEQLKLTRCSGVQPKAAASTGNTGLLWGESVPSSPRVQVLAKARQRTACWEPAEGRGG